MNETVLSVVGLALVVVSLCFAALQTRELTRQSLINNGIGSANALLEMNNLIRAWHEHLLHDPSVRPYFFDGKPVAPDDVESVKVATLADLLADILECELRMGELLPAFTFAHEWHHWPADMLQRSPALAEVVAGNPAFWPGLYKLQRQIRDGEPLAHPLLDPPKRGRPGSLRRPQISLPRPRRRSDETNRTDTTPQG